MGWYRVNRLAVIPPHNSSSWTSVSAGRLYCCQSALCWELYSGAEGLDATQMDGEVDSGMYVRGVTGIPLKVSKGAKQTRSLVSSCCVSTLRALCSLKFKIRTC